MRKRTPQSQLIIICLCTFLRSPSLLLFFLLISLSKVNWQKWELQHSYWSFLINTAGFVLISCCDWHLCSCDTVFQARVILLPSCCLSITPNLSLLYVSKWNHMCKATVTAWWPYITARDKWFSNFFTIQELGNVSSDIVGINILSWSTHHYASRNTD